MTFVKEKEVSFFHHVLIFTTLIQSSQLLPLADIYQLNDPFGMVGLLLDEENTKMTYN